MELLKLPRDFRRSRIRDSIIDSIDFAFRQNDPELKVLNFLKERIDPECGRRLRVVGFGKAGKGMYEGVKRYFGERISSAKIIVPMPDDGRLVGPFLPGDHPLPSVNTLKSSETLVTSVKGLTSDDVVLVLISGGGSSLFELLRDDTDLESYNRTISCMMKSGADITELNAIRYLFSKTKGGGFLNYTYPARVIGIIVSDVPGDAEEVVASGPTSTPPESSSIDQVVARYGQQCSIQNRRVKYETREYRAENYVVLKNSDFVKSVSQKLEIGGFRVVSLGSRIEGNTETVARFLVNKMKSVYERERVPVFVVGGGETSTRLTGMGIGGRNLELSLRVLLLMGDEEDFAFASIGTDGMDGTSKAMGGVVDSKTLNILDRNYIRDSLSTSDSLEPLVQSGDVLFTGFTGTNVADIFISYYAGSK